MKRLTALLLASVILSSAAFANDEQINIYSYRQPFLIEPITDVFTEETGIEVNILYVKAGIAKRLEREGKYSPADLVLTSDFNRLLEITDKGLTQTNQQMQTSDVIPAQFKDSEGHWFALTKRVRAVYASKSRVADTADITYENLSSAQYKGRICTRSGKHPYNVSLVASMIAHHGKNYTKDWLLALKNNLARKPQGNDRGQAKAIKEGLCDLSLGNSYYFGKMLMDEKQKSWANAVRLVFPNQQDRGSHINISGMAMTKYAPHKKNTQQLMAFLTSDKAQSLYAEINMEYPVNPNVEPSELVKSWGEFKADDIALTEIVKHRQTAYKLLDEVKFDL